MKRIIIVYKDLVTYQIQYMRFSDMMGAILFCMDRAEDISVLSVAREV